MRTRLPQMLQYISKYSPTSLRNSCKFFLVRNHVGLSASCPQARQSDTNAHVGRSHWMILPIWNTSACQPVLVVSGRHDGAAHSGIIRRSEPLIDPASTRNDRRTDKWLVIWHEYHNLKKQKDLVQHWPSSVLCRTLFSSKCEHDVHFSTEPAGALYRTTSWWFCYSWT